jgi:hypothetical protein
MHAQQHAAIEELFTISTVYVHMPLKSLTQLAELHCCCRCDVNMTAAAVLDNWQAQHST